MFEIEQSSLGRIVVPRDLPPGKALFYTTVDFTGRLDDGSEQRIGALMAERFGITAKLATCTQVHGAAVERVTEPQLEIDPATRQPGNPVTRKPGNPTCDALWSSERHIALGIKVADCLPITLIDDEHDVIANAHSGWRGAVLRITAATIDALQRDTAFDPRSASAYLGPAIRQCCFEVGEEVVEQFSAAYPNAAPFVDRTRAKPHVDVAGLTADLLRQRGLAAERIFDSGLCTRCVGSIFHSFRRDGKGGGRNLAIVAQ